MRLVVSYTPGAGFSSSNISSVSQQRFLPHSSDVYASISLPFRLLLSTGSSLISTPGPTGLELLCAGKICVDSVSNQFMSMAFPLRNFACLVPAGFISSSFTRRLAKLTLVPPHPNLKAASCAKSSPNPSIKPLMNGKTRLIAAPRNMLKKVGGLYNMSGDDDEEACSSESCELL